MADKITFELFQEYDAGAVADLLNRNHFYMGEHSHKVSGDDVLYVQKRRGMLFSVLAKKDGDVIGMMAAYGSAGQKVAKPHQIFVGTMVVDVKYRLSFSVLVGLYDRIIKKIVSYGYDEILAEVFPHNAQALFLLLKYGFSLFDEKPDVFDTWTLHNYFPAIMKFLGSEGQSIQTNSLFRYVPIVNKKTAHKSKPLIEGRYIECEYQVEKDKASLLIDTKDAKVAGVDYTNYFKLYPDFSSKSRYILLCQKKSDPLELALSLKKHGGYVREELTMSPGEQQIIADAALMEEIRITFRGEEYTLFPNHTPKEAAADTRTTEFEHGKYLFSLDHATGFFVINALPEGIPLIKIMWPCVSKPYDEGVIIPRQKTLEVSTDQNSITVREHTEEFTVSRLFSIENQKVTVDTVLRCGASDYDAEPLSYLWVDSPVRHCVLRSKNDQIVIDDKADLNDSQSMFYFKNYPFWSPNRDDGAASSVKNISLDFAAASLDITADAHSRSVVHFPMFAFFLAPDKENLLNEQNIEHLEIYLNREGFK